MAKTKRFSLFGFSLELPDEAIEAVKQISGAVQSLGAFHDRASKGQVTVKVSATQDGLTGGVAFEDKEKEQENADEIGVQDPPKLAPRRRPNNGARKRSRPKPKP